MLDEKTLLEQSIRKWKEILERHEALPDEYVLLTQQELNELEAELERRRNDAV